MRSLPLFLLLSLSLFGCGKITNQLKNGFKFQNVSAIHSAKKIHIQVFYEPGAEPFAGGTGNLKYWDLLEKNIYVLFPALNMSQILVPKELSEMSPLSSQNKPTWSIQDVKELSDRVGLPSSSDTAVFNIFFVKGYSAEGQNVIGFQITHTQTIVIFKDVINSTGSQIDMTPKYVEQSTLIHEMGHAVGLVNNGLPLTSDHHDSAHGAHCKNQNCVMYYQNEGAADMIKFAQGALRRGSVVLYDNSCIEDARAYKQ